MEDSSLSAGRIVVRFKVKINHQTADTLFLLALSVTSTALSFATTARRLVKQTTAQETQIVTQAQTANAPTARRRRTVLWARGAVTDSVQSRAMATQLRTQQLHQLRRALAIKAGRFLVTTASTSAVTRKTGMMLRKSAKKREVIWPP